MEEQAIALEYSRKCIYLGRAQRRTVYWRPPTGTASPNNTLEDLEIPPQAPDSLRSLLWDFSDLFDDPSHRPVTLSTTHHIPLKSDRRINIKPYPMSVEKKKILYEQVDDLLQRGIIEPSTSSYSSPPVIIERPGKKPRFCIDFRQLNAVTEDEPSVLPHIHENLRDLGDATVFTLLDLRSGYWQVPMAEASKHLTAFSTPDGALYQFTVMPFGLKGAPATFQRLMTHEVLTGYLHEFVKVYLDDILIYSPTAEEHVRHLNLVFQRLRLHHLHISPEKCHFFTSNLDYLGHRINGTLIEPQPKHIQELTKFEAPRTKRQLQSFLGTLNWLRDYIPDVAKHTAPLTRLLHKDVRFKWTQEAQAAFEHLKNAAAQPLVLHRPDHSRPFILQTDGSLEGIGAVLYQEDDAGNRQIISHASATLSSTERRYHVNEIETLAVVWAIKRYASLLADRHFILRTDSRCLLWLNKNRDLKTKLARWSLLLQEYSFEIQHVPGKANELPDYLSRHPDPTNTSPTSQLEEERMLAPANPSVNALSVPELYNQVKQAQRESRSIQRDIFKYEEIRRNEPQTVHEQRILNEYLVDDGLLYKLVDGKHLLIVPRRLTKLVIEHHHDDVNRAHPGRDETIRQIHQLYHWKRLHRNVQDYVKRCMTCATMKTRQIQEAAPLRAHHPHHPFEMVSLDILGPYPESRTKNKYIIMAMDLFTKWVEARAVPRAKARQLIKFFKEDIASRFGRPSLIISDNGSVFKSVAFQNYLEKANIKQEFTGVEHQRANPVERRVQELKKTLRVLMRNENDTSWDNHLVHALHILRNRTNAATQHSPSQLVLGYQMPLPGHWDVPEYRRQRQVGARPAVQEVYARQLDFQNKYAPPNQAPAVTFNVGDRVLAKKLDHTGTTFSAVWAGPYPVVRVVTDVLYEIDRDGGYVVYHVDQLRPAPDDDPVSDDSSDDSSDDDDPEDRQDPEDPQDLEDLRQARTFPSEPRTDEQPDDLPVQPTSTTSCQDMSSHSRDAMSERPAFPKATTSKAFTQMSDVEMFRQARPVPSEPWTDEQPDDSQRRPILTTPNQATSSCQRIAKSGRPAPPKASTSAPEPIDDLEETRQARTIPSEPRIDEQPDRPPVHVLSTPVPEGLPPPMVPDIPNQEISVSKPIPDVSCSQSRDTKTRQETSPVSPTPGEPQVQIAPVVPPIPPIRRRRRVRMVVR